MYNDRRNSVWRSREHVCNKTDNLDNITDSVLQTAIVQLKEYFLTKTPHLHQNAEISYTVNMNCEKNLSQVKYYSNIKEKFGHTFCQHLLGRL